MLNDPVVPDRKCRTPFYGLAGIGSPGPHSTAWQIYYLYRKSRTSFYGLAGLLIIQKIQDPINGLVVLKDVCMHVWMYVCITGRPGPQSTAWHGLDTGTMW